MAMAVAVANNANYSHPISNQPISCDVAQWQQLPRYCHINELGQNNKRECMIYTLELGTIVI